MALSAGINAFDKGDEKTAKEREDAEIAAATTDDFGQATALFSTASKKLMLAAEKLAGENEVGQLSTLATVAAGVVGGAPGFMVGQLYNWLVGDGNSGGHQ